MDPRLPAGWQVHPQDSQTPQQAYNPPQNLNYSYLPIGPALAGVVASNDETSSFAHKYPTINRIQHVLADGQYQEYLYYGDQATIKVDVEKCYQESIYFINDQYQAIQGDYPVLTAYEGEIRNLELKLMANEAQEISAISLAAGFQESDKVHGIKKSILFMMRSRTALLRQDVRIRGDLLQIDSAINQYVPMVMPLQLHIKLNMMVGIQDEVVIRKHFHEAVKGLLPWNMMREQKRAELQRCRETRAGLEKRLRDTKTRLQILEPVRNGTEQA